MLGSHVHWGNEASAMVAGSTEHGWVEGISQSRSSNLEPGKYAQRDSPQGLTLVLMFLARPA